MMGTLGPRGAETRPHTGFSERARLSVSSGSSAPFSCLRFLIFELCSGRRPRSGRFLKCVVQSARRLVLSTRPGIQYYMPFRQGTWKFAISSSCESCHRQGFCVPDTQGSERSAAALTAQTCASRDFLNLQSPCKRISTLSQANLTVISDFSTDRTTPGSQSC